MLQNAHAIWSPVSGLLLRQVLPKGFRRARHFGFLHPNCKRWAVLIHDRLDFNPESLKLKAKPCPSLVCPHCGGARLGTTFARFSRRLSFSGTFRQFISSFNAINATVTSSRSSPRISMDWVLRLSALFTRSMALVVLSARQKPRSKAW